MPAQNEEKPLLEITFSRRTVEQLGISLYSGSLVAAISEMIANGYDAESKVINISIPLNKEIEGDDKIVFTDDGHGMTAEDCNKKFLHVAYSRREDLGNYTPELKRPVMGNKGVGKFSLFGIANEIEIRTVKNGELTHFKMNYNSLLNPSLEDEATEKSKLKPYRPEIVEYKTSVDEPSGTKIFLTSIRKLKKFPNKRSFMGGISRRFSVIDENFRIFVNNEEVVKSFPEFMRTYPKGSGPDNPTVETIEVLGKEVKYWIGFTEKPIDGLTGYHQRGITIITRGRMANFPIANPLKGGGFGTSGLPKMMGVVETDIFDPLDEDTDYIGTSRSEIQWDSNVGKVFSNWLETEVKAALRGWAEEIIENSPKYVDENKKIQKILGELTRKQEKNAVEKAVKNFAKAVLKEHEDPDEAMKIVEEFTESVAIAAKDTVLMDTINQISETEPDAENLPILLDLIRDFDMMELFRVGRIVRGRSIVAEAFRRICQPEFSENEIRDFIITHPWILRPTWLIGNVRGESGLTRVFREELEHIEDLDKYIPQTAMRKRVDGVLKFYNGKDILILELKKRDETANIEEVHQIAEYVAIIEAGAKESELDAIRQAKVHGLLIAEKLGKGALEAIEANNKVEYFSWETHLNRVDAWFEEINKAFENINEVSAWDDQTKTPETVLKEVKKKTAERKKKQDQKAKEIERKKRKKTSKKNNTG